MVRVQIPDPIDDGSDTDTIFGDEKPAQLPVRSKIGSDADEPRVEIHPLRSKDGVIVSVKPPREPKSLPGNHVPCDIVLVLDVSGSMSFSAPAPAAAGTEREEYGLSIMDLTKHAARTILETLDEGDRLGIVTFSGEANVLQPLLVMDRDTKKKTAAAINNIRPIGGTNLWHGIVSAIDLFNNDEINTGRVPAIMVLTDGEPNVGCPERGYAPKLRMYAPLPATIHTFGFGFSLRSGLLKSIAEVGSGNYAFIPDAGMVGTVFVHAVANLQSTFVNKASLTLEYPTHLHLVQTTGVTLDQQEEKGASGARQLTIPLGNIQYGQSRDIFLKYKQAGARTSFQPGSAAGRPAASDPTILNATLEYSHMNSITMRVSSAKAIADVTDMPDNLVSYHVSRSAICSFLASFFPPNEQGEHIAAGYSWANGSKVKQLVKTIPAAALPSPDALNGSLMDDLDGKEPHGQVHLALTDKTFWDRWGRHYLPSLQNAHARQLCNSFKDPGPLRYGQDSPLFVRCRDALDLAFDGILPPKPSRPPAPNARPLHMGSYNRSSNPCFAGFCRVRLAGEGGAEGTEVLVNRLRKGMSVLTPLGPREVVAVVKTRVKRAVMCRVGDMIVTPWHPVALPGDAITDLEGESPTAKDLTWAFPAHMGAGQASGPGLHFTGSIYSILLEKDPQVDAHAVLIGGVWGVTLGHGVLPPAGPGELGEEVRVRDARAHHFFGNYSAVVRSLKGLGVKTNGIALSGGVKRDGRSGLACGFVKPDPLKESVGRLRVSSSSRAKSGLVLQRLMV